MLTEAIESNQHAEIHKKSSWQALRKVSRAWMESGKVTGFGHSDELAEHVVFEIRNFFKKSFGENDLGVREMDRAIVRADYSDVINRGEDRYGQEFLLNNPDASLSIVNHVLNQIKNRTHA